MARFTWRTYNREDLVNDGLEDFIFQEDGRYKVDIETNEVSLFEDKVHLPEIVCEWIAEKTDEMVRTKDERMDWIPDLGGMGSLLANAAFYGGGAPRDRLSGYNKILDLIIKHAEEDLTRDFARAFHTEHKCDNPKVDQCVSGFYMRNSYSHFHGNDAADFKKLIAAAKEFENEISAAPNNRSLRSCLAYGVDFCKKDMNYQLDRSDENRERVEANYIVQCMDRGPRR